MNFPTEFMVKAAQNNKPQIHDYSNRININPLRTSSIFHYTKSFENLISILNSGLYPNYCSEELYDKDEINITLGIPMVSFCDIPLSRTFEHTSRYGSYAIGLATEYAERNNINPVFYINQDSIIRDCFPAVFNSGNKRARCVLPVTLQGLLKRMYGQYDGHEINNYEENEWRYFLKSNKTAKWFRTKEEYLNWRDKYSRSDNCKPDPSKNPYFAANKLVFTPRDINYIIVKDESEVKNMIKHICQLKVIGGSGYYINKGDMLYLINRTFSFEMIRFDM